MAAPAGQLMHLPFGCQQRCITDEVPFPLEFSHVNVNVNVKHPQAAAGLPRDRRLAQCEPLCHRLT